MVTVKRFGVSRDLLLRCNGGGVVGRGSRGGLAGTWTRFAVAVAVGVAVVVVVVLGGVGMPGAGTTGGGKSAR